MPIASLIRPSRKAYSPATITAGVFLGSALPAQTAGHAYRRGGAGGGTDWRSAAGFGPRVDQARQEPMMNHMYSAKVTALGGRSGCVSSNDGRLRADLSIPDCLGGDDGRGTNPEQLFAAAHAASLLDAIKQLAIARGLRIGTDSNVTATVALQREPSGQILDVRLAFAADLPCIDPAVAAELVTEAARLCPYTRATRDLVGTRVSVD